MRCFYQNLKEAAQRISAFCDLKTENKTGKTTGSDRK